MSILEPHPEKAKKKKPIRCDGKNHVSIKEFNVFKALVKERIAELYNDVDRLKEMVDDLTDETERD